MKKVCAFVLLFAFVTVPNAQAAFGALPDGAKHLTQKSSNFSDLSQKNDEKKKEEANESLEQTASDATHHPEKHA